MEYGSYLILDRQIVISEKDILSHIGWTYEEPLIIEPGIYHMDIDINNCSMAYLEISNI